MDAVSELVRTKVAGLCCQKHPVDIKPGLSLTRDLGLDSLDLVDLQMELEDRLGTAAEGEFLLAGRKNCDTLENFLPHPYLVSDLEDWVRRRLKEEGIVFSPIQGEA